MQVWEYILANLELNQTNYINAKFFVMPNLFCNVIVGHDFLKQHSAIYLPFKALLNQCWSSAA